MRARDLLLAMMVLGLCVLGAAPLVAGEAGEDCLRPPRAQAGESSSLADLGEQALERLPWDTKIVRANLSADRPVAIAACYLMRDDLLLVSQIGRVYCLARRDLTPRWVQSLKGTLGAIPSEGPDHYVFLVKSTDASFWVQAFRKRSGGEETGFPSRLPFACSSGVGNSGSRIWVGSLGSPRDNKLLESVSLADGRLGWGWRTRGFLYASPVVDPSGKSVIIASESGMVTSLPAGMNTPEEPNWVRSVHSPVVATPVVTPEHVVVGAQDGTFRCLELASGEVLWFHGLDTPLRTSPWVLGRTTRVRRASGVEGAGDIEVMAYVGIAFARNQGGLHAFDLSRGGKLFCDEPLSRPIVRKGRYVLTMDKKRTLLFRDAESDYEIKGRLGLQMFDLIPTNSTDGAIYGCTHDGGIVAAIPAP